MWSGVGYIELGGVARSGDQEGRRCGNGMTEWIGSVQDSNFTEVHYLIRFAVSVKASRSSGGTARTKASREVMGTNSSPGTFPRTAVAVS